MNLNQKCTWLFIVSCGLAGSGYPQPTPIGQVLSLHAPPPSAQAGVMYSDARSRIMGVWGDGLKEVLDGGFEGKKHYQFTYTINGWWAGCGLNLDNWGTGSPIDLSGFEVLSIAVRGPSSPEHVLTLQLVSTGGEDGIVGAAVVIPPTKDYARVRIPLRTLIGNSQLDVSRIKEIRFSVSGVESYG